MSEPTKHYPPAWGTLMRSRETGDYWSNIAEKRPGPVTSNRSEIVELIAKPEVDRLIAEAVAAERERFRMIAETQRRFAVPSSARSDTVDMWASRTTAECIGMAIESGEQTKGGAT